jgi:hypothetical protein
MSDTLRQPLLDRDATYPSIPSTQHTLHVDAVDEDAPTERMDRAPLSSGSPTLRSPVLTVTPRPRSPHLYPVKLAARRLHMQADRLDRLIRRAAELGGNDNVADLGAVVAYRIAGAWRVRLPDR